MKRLLTLISLCFLFSCGKDDNKEPTKTDLITAGTWKYNDGGIDVNKDGTIDIAFGPGTIPDCKADNSGFFRNDGTGTNDEGATKCLTTDPQSSNFNWSFKSNETILNITGSGVLGIAGDFNILELTSAKFSLSKDTTIAPLGSVAMIANLKH